ncbi:hypothetical protein, partial [Caballeronia sp. INML1]|uniref:hypothetical protein n=1 Tax=Caballeronia sp. INML1 TaxID=2921760 RepID=UPI002029378F
EVVGKHRTGKLTARRSVYNHFSPHKHKCRSALTERHYRFPRAFVLMRLRRTRHTQDACVRSGRLFARTPQAAGKTRALPVRAAGASQSGPYSR